MWPFWIEHLAVGKSSEIRLVRKRCASISAAVSIWLKPASRFQAFCSLSIRKRRICPSRCVAASSLTRIHSRKRQLVACTSAMIFLISLSSIDVFSKSDEKCSVTRVYLTYSLLQGAVLKAASRSPGSLGFPSNSSSHNAPSSNRCILRTGTLLRSALDRWRLCDEFYSTPSKTAKVLPNCPSSGWVVKSLQFHSRLSPWLMLWWGIRRAPSTGGSYHTGASSQPSPPVPQPVVLDVLALPWRSRPSR